MSQLQGILQHENLQAQRKQLVSFADGLGIDMLDCAAALLRLLERRERDSVFAVPDIEAKPLPIATLVESPPHGLANFSTPASGSPACGVATPVPIVLPMPKMVRYRLDVGKKHQLNVKELKKVLVDESGVDKNNIINVMIHGQYTLIELPDEMPQDIFQHLKTVEINNQKLNIKRLKARTKKQAGHRFRRGRPRPQPHSGDNSD